VPGTDKPFDFSAKGGEFRRETDCLMKEHGYELLVTLKRSRNSGVAASQ
jgi:hypothetical protein